MENNILSKTFHMAILSSRERDETYQADVHIQSLMQGTKAFGVIYKYGYVIPCMTFKRVSLQFTLHLQTMLSNN